MIKEMIELEYKNFIRKVEVAIYFVLKLTFRTKVC